MDNVKIVKLANGLSVVLDYIPTVESVLCGLWVACGSRNENISNNGISHFLEHMAFKGTGRRSYTDIAEEVENIGGDMNAYTSKDHTFFYIKALKEFLEVGVDIISDIILNSKFDEGEIEKEKNVVLQELYNSLDTPDDIIYDYFLETAFPNQVFGRPILGDKKSILGISKSEIKDYISSNYCADKMYLIVSGNFDEDNVLKLANQYFIGLGDVGKCVCESAIYKGGIFIKDKSLIETQVMVGFPSVPVKERERACAHSFLASVLGGGMSSRLFQSVRERLNLVYSIYAAQVSYSDCGYFYIATSTEAENVNKVIDGIEVELRKIRDGGILKSELDRVKVGYRSNSLMRLENTGVRAKILGSQMQFFGRRILMSESLALVSKISVDDLYFEFEEMLKSGLTVALYGDMSKVYGKDEIVGKLSLQ